MKVIKAGNETDWADWVWQITFGNAAAEGELFHRYKDGVAIIIGGIVRNESVAEDLSQETFRISLEKIREGDLREPEKLSGFICGVARNVALGYVRRMRRLTNQEGTVDAEQIRDPQPDQFEQLWRKERSEIIHQLLGEIKIERDREVLSRYYIAEEDKEQICADLGLTSNHFNSVIFRALKRYKELYIKRIGES